jgi:hypothetical protein
MLTTTCEMSSFNNEQKNEELQKIYLKHFFHMKVTMNKIVNFKKTVDTNVSYGQSQWLLHKANYKACHGENRLFYR